MKLIIDKFMGVAPAVRAEALNPSAAQTATNTDLFGGAINAYKNLTTVATPTKPGTKKSIHRFGKDEVSDAQYWFTWTTDVCVVRGLVAADTTERTYFTGDGVPKVTDNVLALTGGTDYPMASYTLGVPAPTTEPTLTPANGSGTDETRAYVYTFVTGWGEESAPSPASVCTVTSDGSVAVSNMDVAPGGAYNIVTKRVYRSITRASGTDYFYVGEVAVATTSFNDDVAPAAVGEPLPSLSWRTPPTDLQGLTMLNGGILAGYTGKQVCLSEPYVPYAWPLANRYTVDYEVVGVVALPQSFAVLTTGRPYMGFGTDPGNMTMQPLEIDQSCVSRPSIARFGSGALFASPDGLIYIGTDGARNVLDGIFRRTEWQALNPPSMRGITHDGRYYGFYDTGGATGGFVYSPDGSFVFLNFFATATFVDLKIDALYFAVGAYIQKWNTGSALPYVWRSKKFLLQTPVSFSAARVVASSYSNLTAKFYANGSLIFTQVVTSNVPFRLPSGQLYKQWEVQLEGTDGVLAVQLATSIRELQDG